MGGESEVRVSGEYILIAKGGLPIPGDPWVERVKLKVVAGV